MTLSRDLTKQIQTRLNELGFGPLKVDGLRGDKTKFAIIQFKKSIGLWASDYVGPLTVEALFKKVAPVEGQAPWMVYANKVMGLHEKRDYSQLKLWLHSTVAWIDPREIPWCGAFVATIMKMWDANTPLPDNPLGARNWLNYGRECKPQPGAIMVFKRPGSSWSGHVGFYIKERADAYLIRGGNQTDAVTDTWIAKDRFLGARAPLGHVMSGGTIIVTSSDALSENEA